MKSAHLGSLLYRLRQISAAGADTDAALLARFNRGDHEAFTSLVERHSALVWGVCRRVLSNVQDSEDVFQATFLALSQQAGALSDERSLTPWLYTVAVRLATKVRRRRSRPSVGALVPELVSRADPLAEVGGRELGQVFDEEMQRLPEKFRQPLVLCCLEGRLRDEAAALIGCTPGALKSRLERGRDLLRKRLERRGVELPATLLLTALSHRAAPASVCAAAARIFQASSPAVLALVKQSLGVSLMVKCFVVAAALGLTAVGIGVGGTLLAEPEPAPKSPPTASAPVKQPPKEQPAETAKPRLDRFGDPLPANAVARLGSLRFFHGETVDRVALSPDGQWIVSGGRDGNRLWETATGRELPLDASLKQAPLFTVKGKLVAAERGKESLRLWDVATGKKVRELPVDLSQWWFGLSPDGRTVVWWALDPMRAGPVLRFCDVVTGKVEDPIELPANEQAVQFAFTADSKILVTGHQTQSLHMWDVASRKELRSTPTEGVANSGMKIALAPDGSALAIAPSGKPIRLLDVRTLKDLPPLLDQEKQHVNALSFSADGKRLAVSYPSKTVHVWDMETGPGQARRIEGNGSQVYGHGFSADGKFLVGGDGQSVTLWDLATGKVCPICELGHTYCVGALSFSPDGTSLVSGAGYTDATIHLWDPRSGQEKGRWTGHAAGIQAIAYSPNGRLVASGSQDRTIRLWEASTGKEVRRLEPGWALAFAPDGKTLASSGGKKAIHLWEVDSGRELRSFDNPGGKGIMGLAFFPDGKTLATQGYEEPFLRLWSVADGKQLRQLPESKMGDPLLPLSPDGRLLAAREADGTIRLLEIDTGKELPPLAPPLPKDPQRAVRASAIAFSPDGRTLAVAYYEDRMVRLWELASSQERASFPGHRSDVASVAFSPDGTLLASGSWDRTVLIWDVTGRITATRPFPAGLTAGERNTLWNDLASLDAATAFRAVQRLSGAGQATVTFLKERLHPVAAVDGKQINQLIADLDSDQFAVRQQASRELEKLGDRTEPALRRALAGNPLAEVRQRLERIQKNLITVGAPDRLRGVRAVEVLEQIGSVEARRVVESLSRGAPEARLTREALAALARLRK